MAIFQDISQLSQSLQNQTLGQGLTSILGQGQASQYQGGGQMPNNAVAGLQQLTAQTPMRQGGGYGTGAHYPTAAQAPSLESFVTHSYNAPGMDDLMSQSAELQRRMAHIAATQGRNQEYWALDQQRRALTKQIQQTSAQAMPKTSNQFWQDYAEVSGQLYAPPTPSAQQGVQQPAAANQPTAQQPTVPAQTATPKAPPLQQGVPQYQRGAQAAQAGYTSHQDMRNVLGQLNRGRGW